MGIKFMENAIAKQDKAYKLSYAIKEFTYSCHLCASRNLLHCDCITCPINTAHCRAVKEIRYGERKAPKKDVQTYRDSKGHVTVVVRNCTNTTVNVKIK